MYLTWNSQLGEDDRKQGFIKEIEKMTANQSKRHYVLAKWEGEWH